MSRIREQLEAQLVSRIQSGGAEGPFDVRATCGESEVTITLEAVDRIGCSVLHIEACSARWAGASVAQLKEASEQLARRLNYLLEPIAPIEFDAEGCIVQMRSVPPQRNDDQTCYYELLVRRKGAALARYAKSPGRSRRVVAAHLTREVLMRLVDDLTAV